MGLPVQIRYVKNPEIDREKWDSCITQSSNGLIYAYSFYLDTMSKHWDALVLDDYKWVMPLTWKSKYGIKYLYQPFLTAQLGVFGNELNAGLVESFLQAVPTSFRYWNINLNYGNIFNLEKLDLHQRVNFVLDLNESYEKLYSAYRENIQRNCKKCYQLGCAKKSGFDVQQVIDLAWEQMRSHPRAARENLDLFRKLYRELHSRQQASTYGIFSAKNELLASAVFFFSHNRSYYILVGNHPDGRTLGASHALIDAFIQDHAGNNLLLDFEGSDIRNLAFFYSSFGGKQENYAAIRLNRLPFYLKWLKK